MNKHTMELVWHSCTECLPKEKYNPRLYITNGKNVFEMVWFGDSKNQYFLGSGRQIIPGVNSDGWWWADLIQTVHGFTPIQEK